MTGSRLAGAQWRISSHGDQNGTWVEAAPNLPGIVSVRDSKGRRVPALALPAGARRATFDDIRSGQLGL
jgi:hypothetical protein